MNNLGILPGNRKNYSPPLAAGSLSGNVLFFFPDGGGNKSSAGLTRDFA